MELKNTKLIFLYKTFLFKKTIFTTKNKDLDNIVTALNIKDRLERIKYIYEETVKYLNTYYKDDFCNFINNQCIAQRLNKVSDINGCCKHCKNVGSKGCTTSNIGCKLIYCKTSIKNFKLIKLREIPILKFFSLRQKLILKMDVMCKKEEIIKDLNYGIIYSSVRNFIKDITNKFKK